MTVYWDIILMENLCMNFIILIATAYIMKVKIYNLRVFLSALLGGIYAILVYMQFMEIYSNIILKIILSIVMVYIAFKPQRAKILIKELILFYLVSFVFGGCAFALLYWVKPQEIFIVDGVYIGTYPVKIVLLGAVIGFLLTYTAFKIIKSKMTKKGLIYEISIKLDDKNMNVNAMLDTGNM